MKYTYQKKAKLVGNINKRRLWLLNTHDDWIHDQYGESYIYYGTIHSIKKAFHPLSTSITGYFQDEDSKKWIKVNDGVAIFNNGDQNVSWKENIEEFIKVSVTSGVYKFYRIRH
jgi:hypothetical protein